jgi:hypothetical protein
LYVRLWRRGRVRQTGMEVSQQRRSIPSIMYSLTISQSCFMWNSERYLHSFAASSQASTDALFGSRAGPGCGTLTAGAILRSGRRWRRRRTGGRSVRGAAQGADQVNVRSQFLGTFRNCCCGSRTFTGLVVCPKLEGEGKVTSSHCTGATASVTKGYCWLLERTLDCSSKWHTLLTSRDRRIDICHGAKRYMVSVGDVADWSRANVCMNSVNDEIATSAATHLLSLLVFRRQDVDIDVNEISVCALRNPWRLSWCLPVHRLN